MGSYYDDVLPVKLNNEESQIDFVHEMIGIEMRNLKKVKYKKL